MQQTKIKYICFTVLVCFLASVAIGASAQAPVSLDSIPPISADSMLVPIKADSAKTDSSIVKKPRKAMLDDILKTKNQDSLIYDMKTNRIYMYEAGVVEYQDKTLEADYIDMDIDNDKIVAKGVPKKVKKEKLSEKEINKTTTAQQPEDSITYKQPTFKEGTTTYNMDSIVYNLKSEKAKIYGIAFKEGEGTLKGKDIKKMDDEVYNIHGGTYSTCDADCPHFYLKMSKAQYVQGKNGKKVIIGPSYLVIEDVPLPLGVPFGFFPMMTERNSGIILPEVGEENIKGFYLRDMGYYFAFNDYVDAAIRGGIYTMGSWETSLTSTYKVKYKFNGNLGFNYAKDIFGTKDSPDYKNMSNYSLRWTHSQDPKFMPGSTFSANVNYASSSYNKYDSESIQDYVSAQTNSSVSYTKNWIGKPFSLSTNIQHSQSNLDSTVVLSLPNFVFNVQRIFPFQRKEAVGKQRWYEKISFSYTNTFNNTINTKQDLMFKPEMFDNMKYGMKHEIPVNTSFNILKFLNVSPSFNYTERWYFNRINKYWDPKTESINVGDTTSGFYRAYDYRISASLSTKIYGMFEFKGKNPAVKAIRHVLTPSISGSFMPDFGNPKYGFYKPIQSNKNGDITYYSPYEQGIYGVPSMGRNASLSFSLGNILEMKVRSDKDTTGYQKVKILESLNISSSYNFLADSMRLSPFSITARTTLFKTMGINFNATLDPYAIDARGRRIAEFSAKKGSLVRLTNLGFSFGYSFRSLFGYEDKGTGSGAMPREANEQEKDFFARSNVDYAEQQQYLSQSYYNFSVPWNLSFTYNFSYSKQGLQRNITQTLGFNGSVNLTSKFGLSFNGGFDFDSMTLTPGSIGLTRDLHCWQMSFNWVPIGFRKSWNFKINVKSGMLRDLKYEKRSGYLDNYSSYY